MSMELPTSALFFNIYGIHQYDKRFVSPTSFYLASKVFNESKSRSPTSKYQLRDYHIIEFVWFFC
jgi:hypothetical protein